MTAHKDIKIQFEIDGRRYEAVGFLNEGERSVAGNELLLRVNGVIGKEDVEFIAKHRRKMPMKSLRYYTLLTGYYVDQNHTACFFWFDRGCRYDLDWVVTRKNRDCLMLRSCA